MSGNLVPNDPAGVPAEQLSPLPATWDEAPRVEAGSPALARYSAALLRYKWLMLAVTVAGTAIGFGVTRFLKPEYEVNSTIWISAETPKGGGSGPIRADELLSSAAWVELLRSFVIVDPVVTSLKLYLVPRTEADSSAFTHFDIGNGLRPGAYTLRVQDAGRRFQLLDSSDVVLDRGAVGDSIGRAVGFHWAPTAAEIGGDRDIAFTVTTPREASISLLQRVNAGLPNRSTFLKVSLTGTQPERLARTLNTWNQQFVAAAADLKRRNSREFAKILESQLTYAERQLRASEIALETFRVNTITLPAEQAPLAGGVEATQGPVYTNYFADKVLFDNTRRDREALEKLMADQRAGKAETEAILSIPTLLANDGAVPLRAAITDLYAKRSELVTLRQVYTDEHKRVKDTQEAIRTLEAKVPQLSGALLLQLRRREVELDRRVKGAGAELRNIPTRTIEEMRLRREVDVAEGLYKSLQMRYAEAKLSEASAVPDVSILDTAATPLLPTKNQAPQIILIALLASLGAAVGLALLLDHLDRRFRYPEQAANDLGLSIFGAVPHIRRGRSGLRDPAEAAQVVEAFRSIRLALQHSFDPRQAMMFAVSSPGVHDGKSLISSNLALSFAEAGYRTLLIDGDTRRGAQHVMFGVDQRPGLLDYLAETAPIEEVLRSTAHERLHVLPCGTRLRRGPELIASPAMNLLATELRARYQVIVVDTPPLGAGIDPFALGAVAGNLLIVLRTGETDRRMAQAKLKLLDRLPVRVMGAVLNGVEAKGVYRYYSYLYGYTASDEEPAQLTAPAGEATART